jgi:hypothetical protein
VEVEEPVLGDSVRVVRIEDNVVVKVLVISSVVVVGNSEVVAVLVEVVLVEVLVVVVDVVVRGAVVSAPEIVRHAGENGYL